MQRVALSFTTVLVLLVAFSAVPTLPIHGDSTPAVTAPTTAVEVWTEWRGPHRDGHAPGADWPTSFGQLEPAWRVTDLGSSYSGPMVSADRVFTTETRDEKYEVVSAYDRLTGELLWTKQWPGAMKVPFFAAKNGSWIRATPAYDPATDTLYVGGILEVLVALDGATGAERWRIDFPTHFGTEPAPFGFVCSPLVLGEHLIVEAGGHLVKIEQDTGDIVWATKGFSGGDMMSHGTFSSPVFTRLAGRDQLIVQTRLELRGVDAETGAILWSQPVPAFRGMNILTPLVVALDGDENNAIFTSTHRHASFLYRIEATCDAKIDPAQCDRFSVETVWQNEAQAYMSSPVLVGDTLYVHLGNGRLTALDLASGERLWTSKPFGKYWSMAVRGQSILALDEGGELLLVDHDREGLQLKDRHTVADTPTWAHLAITDDLVFVREQNALAAWRWSAAKPSAEPSGSASVSASP
ncbi:MAG: PQQ-binding-like beta-propeller repeat protein [Acidobacteriota bacterium]